MERACGRACYRARFSEAGSPLSLNVPSRRASPAPGREVNHHSTVTQEALALYLSHIIMYVWCNYAHFSPVHRH